MVQATYVSLHFPVATLNKQTDEIDLSNVFNPVQSVLCNWELNIYIFSQPQILRCV